MKRQITTSLLNSLRNLGLTDHQAKIYSALVLLDQAQAKELLGTLDISKPSIYSSLASLEEIGLVTKVCSKPAVYKAVTPEIGIRLLLDRQEKAGEASLRELSELEKEKIKRKSDEATWAIYGRANIAFKLEDMLSHAERCIRCTLSGTYLRFFLPYAESGLAIKMILVTNDETIAKMATARFNRPGNRVCVISPETILEKSAVMLGGNDIKELLNYDHYLDLIVDDRETFSIPPIDVPFQTGMYSSNRNMVLFSKLLGNYFYDTYLP
ncbi:MAG: hypothetical protein LUQ25_05675 [Methanoregulaceae archaeon]|nr:hypothetical protein [Methanoregulaceae archaeon]